MVSALRIKNYLSNVNLTNLLKAKSWSNPRVSNCSFNNSSTIRRIFTLNKNMFKYYKYIFVLLENMANF